ncbi:MAG: hypothetical protein GC159_16385 [Phycisphaera sp.]|nr:hypothetical protein [Phycisphaera sp.]
MKRRTIIAAVLAIGLLAAVGLLSAPKGVTASTTRSLDPPTFELGPILEAGHDAQLEGRVVDLSLFLRNQPTLVYTLDLARPIEQRIIGSLDPNVPIGLVVDKHYTSSAAGIAPAGSAYVIVFDPDATDEVDAYLQARSYLGMYVKVAGKTFDRDGMRGLLITHLEPLTRDAE